MRTIGVRSAPIPAPRPAPCPAPCSKQPPDPPKPLPRTKFLQKNKLESPATVTTQVIPTNLPPPHARPVRPKCISTRIPPPKPPRSPSTGDNFGQDATSWPRRPGLMEVLSFTGPATAASTVPAARRQFLPTVTPTRPAPQGRGGSTGAIPTRRAPRPRLQPLSLPPPSTVIPTTVVSNTTAPRVPSRPTAAQLAASRTPAGASGPRPAPPSAVGLRTASNVQSPVCSTEDFEGSCRDVFRNTRTAKELTGRGKHMQAANHYQKALTALDRVLRAQVLSLTHHEPTRQRLFLMQQEVFSLRLELKLPHHTISPPIPFSHTPSWPLHQPFKATHIPGSRL
ncbi:hypothetical protein GWK47_017515 [Chionoecetes opilio]|uniref:Uncharacterized protein n=1 Tax=Chionoecetes opilio TaxID=41210 RepID=A0A8J5BYG5_CHIOP|nr:hypothetical protein GWK47_017515 [Chionoecetes opilio]